MQEDNIKEIINDARVLAKVADSMTGLGIEGIASRLERLAAAKMAAVPVKEENAMQEDNNQLKIGTLPAKYIKGEGVWTAFAVNNEGQVYHLNIKKFKDAIVAIFRIDGEVRFSMYGSSFHRVLKCAAAASNAYIQENVHHLERKRRRRAEAREDRKGDFAQ